MSTDQKEALTSGRKPDITHVRGPAMVYIARACEYGNAKYERANYLRKQPTMADDFRRFRAYLRAQQAHTQAVLDAMEVHEATDPSLKDKAGMKRAAFCADTDATPGAKVGASGLPHLCGAGASYNMAVTQAVLSGLLPADPGRPWEVARSPEYPCRAASPGKKIIHRRDMVAGQYGRYVGGDYDGGEAHGDWSKAPDYWVEVDA